MPDVQNCSSLIEADAATIRRVVPKKTRPMPRSVIGGLTFTGSAKIRMSRRYTYPAHRLILAQGSMGVLSGMFWIGTDGIDLSLCHPVI